MNESSDHDREHSVHPWRLAPTARTEGGMNERLNEWMNVLTVTMNILSVRGVYHWLLERREEWMKDWMNEWMFWPWPWTFSPSVVFNTDRWNGGRNEWKIEWMNECSDCDHEYSLHLWHLAPTARMEGGINERLSEWMNVLSMTVNILPVRGI